MIKYEKYNNNPKGRKTGDCVIRAISEATGVSWEDIVKEQCEEALKSKYAPGCKEVYEKVLSAHGFYKMKQPRKPNGKKYLVGEIDKVTKKKTIVISMANHLTVVKNGVCKDLWDCREKTIGNYYVSIE